MSRYSNLLQQSFMFNEAARQKEDHNRTCRGLLKLATQEDLGMSLEVNGDATDFNRMVFALENNVMY